MYGYLITAKPRNEWNCDEAKDALKCCVVISLRQRTTSEWNCTEGKEMKRKKEDTLFKGGTRENKLFVSIYKRIKMSNNYFLQSNNEWSFKYKREKSTVVTRREKGRGYIIYVHSLGIKMSTDFILGVIMKGILNILEKSSIVTRSEKERGCII